MILTINTPDAGHLLIKVGQNLDFDTPFAERKISSDIRIPLTTQLGIPPAKIFTHLKKFVGEEIKKGEILALKKSFISTKKIISDYQGRIKEIDHNVGEIVISVASGKKNSILSPVKGEVNEIKKNCVLIKVKGGKEFPLKKTSDSFGGEVYYLKKMGAEHLSSHDLGKKILFCESINPYLQSKTEALDIKGYVTLTKLEENTPLPYAQIKDIDDADKIFESNFPYCLVDTKSSTITFYK